ncbi:hypothetical protein [Candidatus Regiella insecticola]|uniref:Uncharacterized protein n=1 Tax=Candidatus Regiella insecticola TaxID=138073 RepID=A0A6L2ZPZ0_9ENTR|nr:hypothetical protein [Candidatus Regiella insecticola]GFN46454.1 hypothetical protein RINTU1_20710 [Candidatus Regiella insecticola]
MKLFHKIISCIMLVSTAAMATEETQFVNPCRFPTPTTEAPLYSLIGINESNNNYHIEDNKTQIQYSVEVKKTRPRPFLLIGTYLCDSNDQALARALTTNFNLSWIKGGHNARILRNTSINLPVEEVSPGDYKLVIRVLDTQHKEKIDIFPVTLSSN